MERDRSLAVCDGVLINNLFKPFYEALRLIAVPIWFEPCCVRASVMARAIECWGAPALHLKVR